MCVLSCYFQKSLAIYSESVKLHHKHSTRHSPPHYAKRRAGFPRFLVLNSATTLFIYVALSSNAVATSILIKLNLFVKLSAATASFRDVIKYHCHFYKCHIKGYEIFLVVRQKLKKLTIWRFDIYFGFLARDSKCYY